MLWGEQVLLGWALLLAAASLNRMGPSFERSKYAGPVAALGIALILLVREPPLYFERGAERCDTIFQLWCIGEIYDYYLEYIFSLAVWLVLAYFGMRLIISGSNWYTPSNPPFVFAGWILVGSAWLVILQMDYYLWALIEYRFFLPIVLAYLLGIALAALFMFKVIQWTEARTPREKMIEALSEREQRLVTELIRRNLGGEQR